MQLSTTGVGLILKGDGQRLQAFLAHRESCGPCWKYLNYSESDAIYGA